MSSYYGVKVWSPGAQRARWLTPNGGLTTKRIHALTITDHERAAKLARDVVKDNPDAVDKAKAAAL